MILNFHINVFSQQVSAVSKWTHVTIIFLLFGAATVSVFVIVPLTSMYGSL